MARTVKTAVQKAKKARRKTAAAGGVTAGDIRRPLREFRATGTIKTWAPGVSRAQKRGTLDALRSQQAAGKRLDLRAAVVKGQQRHTSSYAGAGTGGANLVADKRRGDRRQGDRRG